MFYYASLGHIIDTPNMAKQKSINPFETQFVLNVYYISLAQIPVNPAFMLKWQRVHETSGIHVQGELAPWKLIYV